jgi:hypothetical protein
MYLQRPYTYCDTQQKLIYIISDNSRLIDLAEIAQYFPRPRVRILPLGICWCVWSLWSLWSLWSCCLFHCSWRTCHSLIQRKQKKTIKYLRQNKKKTKTMTQKQKRNTPSGVWTRGQWIKSPTLYRTELRGLMKVREVIRKHEHINTRCTCC